MIPFAPLLMLGATLGGGDEPSPLPAWSVVCVAQAGEASVEHVRRGECPHASSAAPVDAWIRFELPAGTGRMVLSTTDLFTIKRGAIEVWVNGGSPALADAADAPADRPWIDGRLAVPIDGSASEATPVLVRLRLRDQRQVASPERQLLLQTAEAARRAQASRWFWHGGFFALALIMALYNAFLWRAERMAAAAWYSVTLVSLALYFAVNHNFLPLLPLPGVSTLALAIHPAVAPLLMLGYVGFVLSYADLGPRGRRVLGALWIANAVAIVLASALDPLGQVALAATIANVCIAVGAVGTLACLAVSSARGDGPSRVVLGTMGAPFVGGLVQIGVMIGVAPPHGLASAALQLGVSVQVVLLALALADRIRRLRVDRDQADAIVRLTLPDPIAERLKASKATIADRHAQVAVLFADLAGFTPLSAGHDPEQIVKLLDALFSEMDRIAHRVGAEKIKTIGDCYMVIAGAPHAHPDPVAALAEFALELPEACARAREGVRHLLPDLPEQLPMRVGMHVGPVVAGVLGQQKLAYDLWGDTVNTASRMESHGIVGRVQCTREVVEALGDRYVFEPRGEILVRGKGALEAWLLVGRRQRGGDSQ